MIVQDPSKRFATIVMSLGIVVLVAAIAIGERAGDRVIGQVTEKRLQSIAPITVAPASPNASTAPYGPDWKRTDVMAAAPDPGFPDPRVPPAPLPTPLPPPKYTPQALVVPTIRPLPKATPNLNLPIWRRTAPLPTAPPAASPRPSESPSPAPEQTSQPRSVL
ncbi:MAG TPA: hypothetical protein VGR69_10630 [Candidatus Rubrimentiphilum sp.]|nr:hypothetical protein [Candidatus Rubrimentiphilum sp.]